MRRENKSRKQHYITNYRFRWIALGLDFLVFVAVAVYSFFAYQQWQAMSGQLREMRKSTEATHLDQRAWVAAAVTSSGFEVGKEFVATITVRNTGKTFAKDVRVFCRSDAIARGETQPDFAKYDDTGVARPENTSALLAPGMELIFTLGDKDGARKLTAEHLALLKSGEHIVWVHGKITYKDVFKCDHWTTFCVKLNPSTLQFASCEAYDDADDNRCSE